MLGFYTHLIGIVYDLVASLSVIGLFTIRLQMCINYVHSNDGYFK